MRARSTLLFAVYLLLVTVLPAAAAEQPDMDDAAAHGAMTHGSSGPMPTRPGQSIFGTVTEIVGILEASPDTDWPRVNIPALRKHLIDMNEVALNANAETTRIHSGVRIKVTGSGRTLEAIHRMLAMHARTMDGRFGWHVGTKPLENGNLLTVTSADPAQVAKIQGLGFMGIMVYGTHHGRHHLAIARGDMPY